MLKLKKQAKLAGGRIYLLLGNHELLNLAGDDRYVSHEERFDPEVYGKRVQAFAASGALYSILKKFNIAARVGDTVYVHGGISPTYAKLGVDGINKAAQTHMPAFAAANWQYHKRGGGKYFHNKDWDIFGNDGPLWYRGFATLPESKICGPLQQSLKLLGVKRMVVGHTIQPQVHAKCDGRLIMQDVAISSVYDGGHVGAVEIRGDSVRMLNSFGWTLVKESKGIMEQIGQAWHNVVGWFQGGK